MSGVTNEHRCSSQVFVHNNENDQPAQMLPTKLVFERITLVELATAPESEAADRSSYPDTAFGNISNRSGSSKQK